MPTSAAYIALEAVKATPGKTSAELAHDNGLDHAMLTRRLPELSKRGEVIRGEARPDARTGRPAVTWWPAGTDIAAAAESVKRKIIRYDCGSRGMLTKAEIVKLSGISERNIDVRIAAGTRGEDLCRPAGAPRTCDIARQPKWTAFPLRGVFTWCIVGIPTEDSR